MMHQNFEIKKTIAEISRKGNTAKRLTLTSWNGSPAKLDLRTWITDEEPAAPGKGITFTEIEGKTLADAINAHLNGI